MSLWYVFDVKTIKRIAFVEAKRRKKQTRQYSNLVDCRRFEIQWISVLQVVVEWKTCHIDIDIRLMVFACTAQIRWFLNIEIVCICTIVWCFLRRLGSIYTLIFEFNLSSCHHVRVLWDRKELFNISKILLQRSAKLKYISLAGKSTENDCLLSYIFHALYSRLRCLSAIIFRWKIMENNNFQNETNDSQNNFSYNPKQSTWIYHFLFFFSLQTLLWHKKGTSGLFIRKGNSLRETWSTKKEIKITQSVNLKWSCVSLQMICWFSIFSFSSTLRISIFLLLTSNKFFVQGQKS